MATVNGHQDENPLFWPIQVGNMTLNHRVVLAPMTRCRAIGGITQAAHVEHYTQRASPGGLLITEANTISPEASGFVNSPGIYTQEQVEAWKKVVDAVHAKGAYIYCQIWHVGRASHAFHQPNGQAPVSSTSRAIQAPFQVRLADGVMAPFPEPRLLATKEIPPIVQQFRLAARNAIAAGFDGVELHAAHGYLVDQFLKDGINDRTDKYGGSMENRCRFLFEIVNEIASEIGSQRTSVRISPIIDHIGAKDSDPVALGLHLVRGLSLLNLAYLHVTEPRFHSQGISDTEQDCKVYRDEYKGVFMSSGGFTREEGMKAIRSGYTDLVSYGRAFLANPDLPLRFYFNLGLNKYDRSTFYTSDPVVGYTDYPNANITFSEGMKGPPLVTESQFIKTRI